MIRDGEIFTIIYDEEDKVKEDEFEVQNLVNQGELCRACNKVATEDGDFFGNVIYIEFCYVRKLLLNVC